MKLPTGLDTFSEFAILTAFAAAIAALMRFLKQPLLVGYILVGLIAGPLGLNFLKSNQELELFAQMGVAFLLFTVGLNLNPKIIKEHGKAAALTGLGQVVFTTSAGYILARLLGYAMVPSLYISVGLCFSSTIIIMKLIADRGDLDALYARLSMGFLIIQDLVAILLIFTLPIIATGGGMLSVFTKFGTGVAIAAVILALSWWLLPKINSFIARSQEFLMLFAVGWGTGAAALFHYLGFSLESGALLGGISLAVLPSRHEVASRLTPLRDFFLILFFVLLGSQMNFGQMTSSLFLAVLVFTVLVIIGNPLILMMITGAMGFTRRTSFMNAMTSGQVSEFSLILLALGVKLKDVAPADQSTVTLVAVITILISTYFFQHSDTLYRKLSPALKVFEKKNAREDALSAPPADLILIGANRIGFDFIRAFRRIKAPYLIIDHDPDIVSSLRKEGMPAQYGDAGDAEFLRSIHFSFAKRVVSTVPDVQTNLLIALTAKKENPDCTVMAVAHSIENAHKLYDAGVDYVVMPHFLGGHHAAHILERTHTDPSLLPRLQQEHKAYLSARSMLGHEHPTARQYDAGAKK